MVQQRDVDVVGGARLVTLDTAVGRILICMPDNPATQDFPTTAVFVLFSLTLASL